MWSPKPWGQAMRRRRFIQGIAAFAAWPRGARAQQPAKMLRVGAVTGQPKSSPVWQSFIERMTALGYQEGKNFALDLVSANSAEEFESAYRRFVNASVDVIVAGGPGGALKSAFGLPKQRALGMVGISYDPRAPGCGNSR